MTERLTAAAIRRDGNVESRGFKSHWEIRAALGDEDPAQKRMTDEEGFLTSNERFVTRHEAKIVAEECGQVRPGMQRELLSSDINWNR